MKAFEAEMYFHEGEVSWRIAILVKAEDEANARACLEQMYPAAGSIYLTEI